MAFRHAFLLSKTDRASVIDFVFGALQDKQLEVREMAGAVFSGMVRSGFVGPKKRNAIVKKLVKLCSVALPAAGVRDSTSGNAKVTSADSPLVQRHGGVLGVAAMVAAFPYDLPEWMPGVLTLLARHASDPAPIKTAVQKCFKDFWNTHNEMWSVYKQQFDEDQLEVLTDLLVSPNYYA